MGFVSRLRIGVRLALGFGLMLLPIAGMIVSSYGSLQHIGAGQVGEAIAQLDQTTQQNAALVEETAAASQSLDDQARHLVRSVGVFRIDGTSPPMATAG